ncbi:hypothetical protein BV25DRAFT_1826794 [Artomyces pyxidatus]|uniref:Uncharacterized protein n=1 Tax=Artomyces pyxidatus TaxID=48021 RepID=A0ACB8SXK2_9AGAM|nr:hypothetical protein BV25DRAFT_1826794 [Artomyces pyxidatus]
MGLAIILTRLRTATTSAALSTGAEDNPEQQSALPHPLVLQPSETPTPTLPPPSLPPPLAIAFRSHQSFPFVITVFEDRARTQIGRRDQPIKHWLRFAEAARRAGHHAMESGFFGEAFVEYAKAAIIVVEVLPQHRDFDVLLTARQQANLETHGRELLDDLAEVKAAILAQADGTFVPFVVPSLSLPALDPHYSTDNRQDGRRVAPYATARWEANARSSLDLPPGSERERSWSWRSPSPPPADTPLSGMRTPDSFSSGRRSSAKSVMSVSSLKTTMNQYIGRSLPLQPGI